MANLAKHTDVVGTVEEFRTNYEQGLYVAPWIVYVGNNTDGYSVFYSNDEKRFTEEPEFSFAESILQRLENLENEKVFCYESEYDELIANGSGWITNIDGTRSEVVYDANKLYCIYEDDGPAEENEE